MKLLTEAPKWLKLVMAAVPFAAFLIVAVPPYVPLPAEVARMDTVQIEQGQQIDSHQQFQEESICLTKLQLKGVVPTAEEVFACGN